MKVFLIAVLSLFSIILSGIYGQNKLVVRFPDGFVTEIEKSKILRTSYVVTNGVREQIEYYDEWINPSTGRIETFIKDDRIFRVFRTPVKTNSVFKEYTDEGVLNKSTLKMPVPSGADNINFDSIEPLESGPYKNRMSFLTPEVHPEISLVQSGTALKNASKNSLILTDNIPYELYLQFRIDPALIQDVIIKNMIWTFTNGSFEIVKYGRVINVDEIRIPNYNPNDTHQWSLKIRLEVSIRQADSYYRDYFIEQGYRLWVIDCTRPVFDIDIPELHGAEEKFRCSDFMDIKRLQVTDNNINLPDNLRNYKVRIFTRPEETRSQVLKTTEYIEVGKNLDEADFISSHAYFDIQVNERYQISPNYQGPFQMCLQLSDLTAVYTYEVISGDMVDDVPPGCEVLIDGKSAISKADFTGRNLMTSEVAIEKNFKELMNQKRYSIEFTFFDNIEYSSTAIDQVVKVPNNIKSVVLDGKEVSLDDRNVHSTHFIMSKCKIFKLKITDKNNNIRVVKLTLTGSDSEINFTNLQE